MMKLPGPSDFDAPTWPPRLLRESQRMRVATLTRLRWLSVGGQTAACIFVAWGLWYPYPVMACLGLIALSALLNIAIGLSYTRTQRLSPRQVTAILTFDILQPTGLLFLTGGIQNPFSIFLIVPAMIAAATQPAAVTIGLGILAVAAATFLAFVHYPVPWPLDLPFNLPFPYLGGMCFALVTTLVFATFYIYRVAAEARTLSDALTATEMLLQRENHLSALDGLAAAAAHELGTPLATVALVAKEMGRSTAADHPMREDIDLLITQTERCRAILRQLSSLSSSSEEHMAHLPLLSLVEEVVAPHRDFDIAIRVETGRQIGAEPVLRRNPGILYGLGNIVENAVDFAKSEVVVDVSWTADHVAIRVIDDGTGFSADVLSRIGDPYVSPRESEPRQFGGNLGLGVFIAKTLLERSGAQITFGNRPEGGTQGANVQIVWARPALDTRSARQNSSPATDYTYRDFDALDVSRL